MINLLYILILPVLPLLGALGGSQASSGGFVCDFKALTAEERAELPKILRRLAAARPKVSELDNGYELSFRSSKGVFPLAAQWASAENRCCPFFDFILTVTRYGGPMTVRITGPEGVKAFIQDDLPMVRRLTKPGAG